VRLQHGDPNLFLRKNPHSSWPLVSRPCTLRVPSAICPVASCQSLRSIDPFYCAARHQSPRHALTTAFLRVKQHRPIAKGVAMPSETCRGIQTIGSKTMAFAYFAIDWRDQSQRVQSGTSSSTFASTTSDPQAWLLRDSQQT
jgi:hypothetical protein